MLETSAHECNPKTTPHLEQFGAQLDCGSLVAWLLVAGLLGRLVGWCFSGLRRRVRPEPPPESIAEEASRLVALAAYRAFFRARPKNARHKHKCMIDCGRVGFSGSSFCCSSLFFLFQCFNFSASFLPISRSHVMLIHANGAVPETSSRGALCNSGAACLGTGSASTSQMYSSLWPILTRKTQPSVPIGFAGRDLSARILVRFNALMRV